MVQGLPGTGEVAAKVAELWLQSFGTLGSANLTFLQQGGDSLRSTTLIARLNEQLGIRLPVSAAFAFPTLAGLTRECLRHIGEEGAADDQPSLRKRPEKEITGISFSQERMWFMHELASGSAAYHIGFALKLSGPLQVPALRMALHHVVQRHEVLRTTYSTGDQGIVARVHAHDYSLLNETHQRPERVSEYLAEFANGPFALDKGPLLRSVLVHIGNQEAILAFVMHHIVADQWSFDVLTRDLADAYSAALEGRVFTPQPLTMSYAEYAGWHRRWFRQRRQDSELTYWKTRLAGLEPVTLHPDRARPAQKSFQGGKVRVGFDAELADRLTHLGTAHEATLAMVLLTAFKTLLIRYTGKEDISVGVPVANRQHPHAETLVGTCVNTLVLRTDLAGNPSFSEALKRIRATALEAYDHQDLPFELLVKELHLPRDAGQSPLFSVMFNMLNTPDPEAVFPGLSCERFDFDRKAAQFDLQVTIDSLHDHSICFEYAQDLFEHATIQRLSGHYLSLLRGALEAPGRLLSGLPLLGTSELQLLSTWGEGEKAVQGVATVAQMIETSLRQHGDTVACRFRQETLTYSDIGARSRQLMHMVAKQGARRVGLYLQRSPLLLIAQLAVLRSGAAYVPLDPVFPLDRLTYMVEDADLDLIVTEEDLLDDLQRFSTHRPVLNVEQVLASPDAAEPVIVPAPAPDDIAYVIYTSGSTGRPKGVAIPQGAVANLLASMAREPGLTSSDRLLAVTTLSFDIAVLELLLPLTVGAQIVLAGKDEVMDGEALKNFLDRDHITVMQATPSTWRMVIEAGWEGTPGLKVLVGGEALAPELAQQLLSRADSVWNMYGPTETTIWSTCWRVNAPANGITIGKPILNTSLRITDARGIALPAGVPGEICIGGEGLAAGYFRRDELTAQRFVDLEFDPPLESRRYYRTGDLGRWRPDGELEHLGRMDSQVKVRGYRIELGEIESRLSTFPGIRQALVIAREERPGEAGLVAYLVAGGEALSAADLRAHLLQLLPEYMIPQQFIPLEAMPLLPNGKIDRSRLPVRFESERAVPAAQPSNSLEAGLLRVWQDLLNTKPMGVHDNFFEHGGHSMLAMRLVSRIRRDMQRACTLPMVFRNPTVASLAQVLRNASILQVDSVIPLRAEGVGPPIFCICGIHLYQELADALAPHYPVNGIFVADELEYFDEFATGATLPSVERLAGEYLKVIRFQQRNGPYRLLGFSFGGVLAYEIAQQLKFMGEQVELLAILDSDVPGTAFSPRIPPIRHLGRIRQAGAEWRARFKRKAIANSVEARVVQEREERYLTEMRRYRAQRYEGAAIYFKAMGAVSSDPGYGWDALVGCLSTKRIAGDHLDILRAPAADEIARCIKDYLGESRPERRSRRR